jgi:hypothetical protein
LRGRKHVRHEVAQKSSTFVEPKARGGVEI